MSETSRAPVRIVVTGPPGAGKTTSVALLKRHGWVTMGEVARELIAEEQQRGGDVYPWTRLSDFVGRLWEAQRRQFRAARRFTGPVFFDRGMPDALAFLSHHEVAAPAGYSEACRRERYDLVFDLELLPTYLCDPQRPYDRGSALALGRLNQEAYRALGYDLITIPVAPPDARVELMVKEARKYLKDDRT